MAYSSGTILYFEKLLEPEKYSILKPESAFEIMKQ